MTTETERIARLEGAYSHLATQADVARLDGKIDTLDAKIDGMKWILITVTSVIGVVLAALQIFLP